MVVPLFVFFILALVPLLMVATILFMDRDR